MTALLSGLHAVRGCVLSYMCVAGASTKLVEKPAKPAKAPSDKLDSLVAQYKSKLFGGSKPAKAAVTRWFE